MQDRSPTSLDAHLRTLKDAQAGVGADLAEILRAMILAGKAVQRALMLGALSGDFRPSGRINVQQEVQQQLDVVAHESFEAQLRACGLIRTLISEEVETPIKLASGGGYMVALDPIDGSSNMDVNIPTGTIFSVHQATTSALPAGKRQLLAGYVLYGPSMLLLYAHKDVGVHIFTYHPEKDDFLRSHADVRTPRNGTIYSVNGGMENDMHGAIRNYLTRCKERRLSVRYVGSLVADFHRNLLKGGIFIYPSTQANPAGKVRLLYEASPLAFIVGLAGGRATDEQGRNILDISPDSIHQRTPLCIGSQAMVEECVSFIRGDLAAGDNEHSSG